MSIDRRSMIHAAVAAALLVAPRGARAGFGDPLPNLTAAQQAAFADGQEEFNTPETTEEGLGPVFNEAACATCHVGPATAIGGSNQRVETRFGRVDAKGNFDPLGAHGGSLLQDHGIGPVGGVVFSGETVPAEANVVAGRRTTPLFGLGLVDAVPDATFVALAAQETRNDPLAAGRVSMVANLVTGRTSVGKFGWKAQVPSLAQFAADAYLNEMGITSPLFPDENCPQGDCAKLAANPLPSLNDDGTDVGKVATFMTLLGAPPLPQIDRRTWGGALAFASAGCTSCHTPALTTGGSTIAAANQQTFLPFSDFLLHDMGSLGDGIVQGAAGAREMRTAPLWGMRATTRYLHDARATTLRDAVLAHDGQAAGARRRFLRLRPATQQAVLDFVNAL